MNTLAAIFRVKPGAKMDLGRGIRTAVAALAPLLALAALHQIVLGVAAAFGALLVSFCDIGSSARMRIESMGVMMIVGSLLHALGRAIGGPWWLAAPAILLATLVAGLISVYGRAVAVVALFLNLAFVVALGMDGGPSTALPSAFGFLIGGMCAMLLALAPRKVHRDQEGPGLPDASAPAGRPARPARPSLASFLSSLTFSSPALRFAALRAAGAATAALIGWSMGISYPQWVVVPTLTCVMPAGETSRLAAAQLAAGTVAAVLVAELTLLVIHDPLVVAVIAVALMVVALSVRDLNNALFTFFLTLMLLEVISIPIGGVSLAGLRLFATLMGVAIALAVTYLAARDRVIGAAMNAKGPHA